MSGSANYFLRFHFTENSYPTVTFFLRAEPVLMVAKIIKNICGDICLLRLVFLNAHDIESFLLYPFGKPLFDGSPYSIKVIADDLHDCKCMRSQCLLDTAP